MYILFLSLLLGNTYNFEDFHYFTPDQQAHGLPIVNKIYINYDDKKEFMDFVEQKLPNAKGIHISDIGAVISFSNKQQTLDALNICAEKYNASPVVKFEGWEFVAINQLRVVLKPSVKIDDFIKRLNSVSQGEFKVLYKSGNEFLINVNKLKNPSNILILANLVARDTFWVESARVNFATVTGGIRTSVSVESPATANLGETRRLKLVIEVFDPKIDVKKDFLVQTIRPFPFSGEDWIDFKDPEITEEVKFDKRVITAIYSFKYLMPGKFVFQPLTIPYEKNNELTIASSSECRFEVGSVTDNTNITDIQPITGDFPLKIEPLVKPEMPNVMLRAMYSDIKGILSFAFCLTGLLFIIAWSSTLNFSKKPVDITAWAELKALTNWHRNGDWKCFYDKVSNKLNKVLVQHYNTSLYAPSHNVSGKVKIGRAHV